MNWRGIKKLKIPVVFNFINTLVTSMECWNPFPKAHEQPLNFSIIRGLINLIDYKWENSFNSAFGMLLIQNLCIPDQTRITFEFFAVRDGIYYTLVYKVVR